MKKGMIVLLTMLCALGFSGCGNQTTAEQSSSAETVVTTTDAPVTTTAATTTKHGFDVIKNIKVTTTAMEEAPEMNLDQTETIHGFSFLCDSNWSHQENDIYQYWYQSDGGFIMVMAQQQEVNISDLSGYEKTAYVESFLSSAYNAFISSADSSSDYQEIEIDGQPAIVFDVTIKSVAFHNIIILQENYAYCISFTTELYGEKTILSDYVDEIVDSIQFSPATTESTTVTTEQQEPTTTVATTLPPATEVPTQAPTIAPDANSSGQTVIITENGKKYHKKVHGDWTIIGEILESQAVAQGYEPCKTCYK